MFYHLAMTKIPVDAVCVDVDGTLYDHESQCIPAAHLDALAQLQKQGIKIFLCSGRDQYLLKDLGVWDVFGWDGIVGGNGASVYGPDGQVLFSDAIPKASADRIFEIGRKQNQPLFASGNTALITEDTDEVRKILDWSGITIPPVRQPEEADRLCVISIIDGNYKCRRPEYEAIPDIEVLCNTLCTDIHKKGVSKQHGIEILMNQYGLAAYAAFGDALNDLEMLQHAKYGVCMGNGDDRVKAQVKHVCPDCHSGGIALWLKKMGWIQ